MKKITDLNTYHNKKLLLGEAEKLVDYIFEQAKQGGATYKVEQGSLTNYSQWDIRLWGSSLH